MPLPPYIAARARAPTSSDRADYQTMFAREEGAVAAPTAGLHFTPELLRAARRRAGSALHTRDAACRRRHVPAGQGRRHRRPHDACRMGRGRRRDTAAALNAARAAGGRIVAVGTTSLRLLESAAGDDGMIRPFEGETAIFITPGYRFRAVDVLLTNFHLPRSTLFMLVAAFCGLDDDASAPMPTPSRPATASIPMAMPACCIRPRHTR